eukprot:767263-Hanusia_phi.AAC.3
MARGLRLFVLVIATMATTEARRAHGDREEHGSSSRYKQSHGCNHQWGSSWAKGWDCCGEPWRSRQSGGGTSTGWSFFDGIGIDGSMMRQASDKVNVERMPIPLRQPRACAASSASREFVH